MEESSGDVSINKTVGNEISESIEMAKIMLESVKSKRASYKADPLLTNPLNSCTKLQIRPHNKINFCWCE